MQDVSFLSLVGRLIVSLGVVLLLMAGLARLLRKRMAPGTSKGRTARRIEVLARQGLGRNSSVAVVRTGGKVLVVGVTDAAVNLLTEVDEDDLDLEVEEPKAGTPWTAFSGSRPGAASAPTWRDMVERLRERTVRRS